MQQVIDTVIDQCYDIIGRPNGDPERYRGALERITWLLEIKSKNMDFAPNLLGMAQYRCGQFREALETLLKPNAEFGHLPADLAFIAMAHARLGQTEAALVTLDKLDAAMKDPKLGEDARNRGFLREAEELILDPGFPADPFAP